MLEADDFRQARGFSEAAIAAMVAHRVPPTPENYAVWYAYATGLLPELSRMIDVLISNNRELTPELSAELYGRFCDVNRHFNLLNDTGGRLQYAIDQVTRHIKSASGDASAFGKTLDQYSADMGAATRDEELHALVSGLIDETQNMVERNRALEDRLSQSAGEINELRQSLEFVRREALTDPLTGIPNRKFFETRLREAARDALESGDPLSLLIADIDYFKQFNDTYGHQLGDQVLRLVARTLMDSVKGRDTPARYGGEEFAIILPNTRLKDAHGLADQIRRSITRRRIVRKNTGDDFGTITLSIGVSCYRPGEQLQETVRRADLALYHAKHNGRNCVVSEDVIAVETVGPGV